MTRKALLPQNRRHVMIYDEDWEFINDHYGPRGPNPVGISAAIKTILHSHISKLRAKADQIARSPEQLARLATQNGPDSDE